MKLRLRSVAEADAAEAMRWYRDLDELAAARKHTLLDEMVDLL